MSCSLLTLWVTTWTSYSSRVFNYTFCFILWDFNRSFDLISTQFINKCLTNLRCHETICNLHKTETFWVRTDYLWGRWSLYYHASKTLSAHQSQPSFVWYQHDICGALLGTSALPGRFLPTDSGLDVSDTVCTSNRCFESTDRCSGCKLEAIAKAVWCVEASLFPVRWWWWWSVFNGSLIEFIGGRSQSRLSKAD